MAVKDLKPLVCSLVRSSAGEALHAAIPAITATIEHRPTGISPSMATVRLPVLVDVDSIEPYERFDEPSSKVITPPTNLPFAVLRPSSTFIQGAVEEEHANRKYMEIAKGPSDGPLTDARKKSKQTKANVIKLSELLGSEFNILIRSSITRAGDDEILERTLVFENMLVKFVNALQEYPIALNEVCILEVVMFDKRDRWALLSNFNDQINTTKGVDAEGNVGYYNESCFNPLAVQANRRYWNALDLFAYLVHLIDGVPLGGSRGDGFEFDSDHVSKRIVNLLALGDHGETVDDLEVYGGNPAEVLDQFLKRWGCTLIFPHTGEWYITKTDQEDVFPSPEVYKYSTSLTPHNFNPISLRAKRLVVYGPEAQYQEGFKGMAEKVDFDYVVPYNGKWLRLDFAWSLCLQNGGGSLALGGFVDSATYLSASQLARLALLSTVPTGDDYEAYIFEAAKDGELSIEAIRLVISVAENGFRYIRLRRDGMYGPVRKPLPNLISVDSVGDSNRPVVLADSWASADVRGSVRVPFSGWDELTGLAPERFFNTDEVADAALIKNGLANKNFQIRVNDYTQGMSLDDPEALVFSFPQKLVYPTENTVEREELPFTVNQGADGESVQDIQKRAKDAKLGASRQEILRAYREELRNVDSDLDYPDLRAKRKAIDAKYAALLDGTSDDFKAAPIDTDPAKIIDALDRLPQLPDNATPEQIEAARAAAESRSNALIQFYTDKVWDYSRTLDILVASYVPAGTSKGRDVVVSQSAYKKEYAKDDGYDGTSYRYMAFLQARFVVASLTVEGQIRSSVPAAPPTGDNPDALPAETPTYLSSLGSTQSVTDQGGPVQEVRDLGGPFDNYFSKLDSHADRFAADYYNRLRYKLGVDYEFVGVRIPAGGVGGGEKDREGGFIYSPSLSTVMWHVDDEGAFTMARFNNPEAFSPFVSQYERQFVDYLNQQRQFNDVTSLNDFAKQVRKMSAGKHVE